MSVARQYTPIKPERKVYIEHYKKEEETKRKTDMTIIMIKIMSNK